MKNSNDTIENRTHDLPACSSVPQPTVPPCALALLIVLAVISDRYKNGRLWNESRGFIFGRTGIFVFRVTVPYTDVGVHVASCPVRAGDDRGQVVELATYSK